MNRPDIKMGDIIILDSPNFHVVGCKAEVIELLSIQVKILDGTEFGHMHFQNSGCHFLQSNDTYRVYQEIFNDELFTI